MPRLDPTTIDLPTLAALAGAAASEHLLAALRMGGHPKVRPSHGYVFQHLIEGSKTVGELAALLGVTQQAASKSVLELEELGYVERRGDAADSRVRHVALTRRGRQVIERGRALRADLDAEVRSEVGARAVADAKRALAALLERSGAHEAVATRRVKEPRD